jgi:hypothetical protein
VTQSFASMEYMDAGSLEGLAGIDVPEEVLARITHCMVRGLRFLKDELQTMHRGMFGLTQPGVLTKRASCRRQANERPDQ